GGHARARDGEVERNLWLPTPVEEQQAARTPVAVERLVREVGLQVGNRGRELVDGLRLAAEVEERSVAASDAEHEAAARRLLHGYRDVGERGGMPRERVGHAGREPEALGR